MCCEVIFWKEKKRLIQHAGKLIILIWYQISFQEKSKCWWWDSENKGVIIPRGSAKTNPFPHTEKPAEIDPKSSSEWGKTLRARTNIVRLAQASPFFQRGKLLKTQACWKHTSQWKCCVSLAWIKAKRNGLSKQAAGPIPWNNWNEYTFLCL